LNATEKWPPGATFPEFHASLSEVDVWATESEFVHVTVVPIATLTSSGIKALLPSDDAPAGMTTDEEFPPGV
jgi:hypothetical protein